FSVIDKEEEKSYSFGEQVEKSYATFTLTSIRPVNPGQVYQLQFNDLTRLAAYYAQRITIAPVNKDASVLIISLIDPVPEKAEAIIDKLIETYNRETIEDKNQIAQNTVKFIDERLNFLVSELKDVEEDVEQYKRENQITDIGNEAQQYMQEASQYGRQLADYQTQISVLESMENYMKTASGDELVPSSMGISDPTLV